MLIVLQVALVHPKCFIFEQAENRSSAWSYRSSAAFCTGYTFRLEKLHCGMIAHEASWFFWSCLSIHCSMLPKSDLHQVWSMLNAGDCWAWLLKMSQSQKTSQLLLQQGTVQFIQTKMRIERI